MFPTTIIDDVSRTVRPADAQGDEFFGLKPGHNGTAATCRRELAAPEGYAWVRHNGRPAIGLTTIPSGIDDAVNPWSGRISERAA